MTEPDRTKQSAEALTRAIQEAEIEQEHLRPRDQVKLKHEEQEPAFVPEKSPELLQRLRPKSAHPRRTVKITYKPPVLHRIESRYEAHLVAALEPLVKAIEQYVLPEYEGWVDSVKERLPTFKQDAHIKKPGSRGGHIIGYRHGEPIYGQLGAKRFIKATQKPAADKPKRALELDDTVLEKAAPNWRRFLKKGNWAFPQKSLELAQAAVADWLSPKGFREINNALRFGKGREALKPTLRGMQFAHKFAGMPLARDAVVYRVVGKMGFELVPDVEFVDKGYAATTTSESDAKDIKKQTSGGKLLRITIPKGTQVLAPEGKHGPKELLLGAGTKFRITRESGGVFEAEVT